MSGALPSSGAIPYFDSTPSTSSSYPPTSSSRKTIKRYSTVSAARQLHNVAIVGAGIAGLSTALSLVRTAGVPASSITVYEPREGLDSGQGAGLNLNSGAAILSKEYGVNLQRNGIPATRAYSTLSAATVGDSIAESSSVLNDKGDALFDIDFSTRFAHTYLAQKDGSAHVVTMLREDLQSELYSAVSDLGVEILRGAQYTVSGVTEERRIIFKNGNTSGVSFDLIVGADGVRSTVRDMVVEQRRKRRARYTGVKVAWLITRRAPDDSDDTAGLGIVPEGEMRQIICDGGTVVAYAVSNQFDMIAYLYREQKSKDRKDISENVNYGTSGYCKGTNEKASTDSGQQYRRDRIVHHMVKSKVPQTVWKKFQSPGEGSRFIESAVFDHGVLSRWSRNQVVLVGDAGLFLQFFLLLFRRPPILY